MSTQSKGFKPNTSSEYPTSKGYNPTSSSKHPK